MALITPLEVQKIIDAFVNSGSIANFNRAVLLQGIEPNYIGLFSVIGAPKPQLMADIGMMNVDERLASGQVPLSIYLRNMSMLMPPTDKQKIVLDILNEVDHRVTGAPRVDLAAMGPITETIIHVNDMVTYAFMETALKMAGSVLKLRVPRHDNGKPKLKADGQPVVYLGTGWLLKPDLLITNHHVINARDEGEPPAADLDFQLQAANAEALLDFNSDNGEGAGVIIKKQEAADATLDYAVLRIEDTGRPGLALSKTVLQKSNEPTPVNIIQHPRGLGKKYAIRNNLVNASTNSELRYFTDTEGGSSGSPVFNDRWEVVALHRASVPYSDSFQGKATAWVNVGVHIVSILKHLNDNFPLLAKGIS